LPAKTSYCINSYIWFVVWPWRQRN